MLHIPHNPKLVLGSRLSVTSKRKLLVSGTGPSRMGPRQKVVKQHADLGAAEVGRPMRNGSGQR